MNRVGRVVSKRKVVAAAFITALTLSACVQEQPTAPKSPLLPPAPPNNPQILSAAWRMDVNRLKKTIKITPPSHGLNKGDLQLLADYFGVAPGSPDLSILAGDVITIITPGTLTTSAVGAFIPGQVRTTFDVAIQNKLSAVNLITPTFPAPPVGTSGVILFPFEIVVTTTPGGVTVVGDGTEVLVELPNSGLVAPSTDWDVAPFNFFNDTGCGPTSNDCYRSETFLSTTGTPVIQGGSTSQSRTIGFDHDPTVNQFRVRMIVAGDLQDATPNAPPVANIGGPYSGFIGGAPVSLTGAGSNDPDGTVVAWEWDLDNDGQYDDATGVTTNFTCTSPVGAKTIGLRVRDNRSATATASGSVTCSTPANTPPIANIGGPYSGVIGGAAVTLSAAASSDPGGAITAYSWDLNNDGVFGDATTVTASFTCTAPAGAKPIAVRVTDNGSPALTSTATGSVSCGAAAPTTIRGRWVNAAGATITTATAGSTVFLEVDVQLTTGANIHDFQGFVSYSAALASASSSIDLQCGTSSVPAGQASCPSGAAGTGITAASPFGDVMNNFTGNQATAGQVNLVNFSTNSNDNAGGGIQGLSKIQFTVSAAGTLTPTLTVQIAVDGLGSNLTTTVSMAPLTIN